MQCMWVTTGGLLTAPGGRDSRMRKGSTIGDTKSSGTIIFCEKVLDKKIVDIFCKFMNDFSFV